MKKPNKKIWCSIFIVWLVMCMMATVVHAALSGSDSGSFYSVDGTNYFTYEYTWQMLNDNGGNATDTRDDQGSGSVTQGSDSTVLVVSARATKNQNGCDGSNNQITVTVKNNTGKTINVSYTRPTATVNADPATVTFKETPKAAGEVFTMEANETFTIVLYVKRSDGSTNITGTDTLAFNATIPQTAVTLYPSEHCSYTVENITVAQNAESAQTVYFDQGTTLSLSVTVPDGKHFYGWRVSSVGELITTASTSFTTKVDTAVYPVILNANPSGAKPYTVDSSTFDYWEDAVAYATQKATKKVVIINEKNFTMPTSLADNGVSLLGGAYVTGSATSVNYIVPAGVTLLVANDDAKTVYTSKPGGSESYKDKPSIYQTLNLASGTSITVNGALSIAGMQCAEHNTYPPGTACGPLGYIHMEAGSKITVNAGANLYAWGYITGSGSVDVYGTVYEDLQISDWRGGAALSTIYNNDLNIMPLSLFYVQNVQVPMTLHHGAVEHVSSAATVASQYRQFGAVFLGSGGMVNLNDSTASLTKDYDEENDRIVFTLNGNCSIGGFSITVPAGSFFVSDVHIDSTNFYMPVNTTWDFTVKSGSNITVAQDIAMLPGSTFIVESGATVTLGEGAKICVYDAENWGKYVFKPSADYKHIPSRLRDCTTHDHSDEVEIDAYILVNGTIDATNGHIYTTNAGANIHSTGSGKILIGANTGTTVHQFQQMDDPDDSGSDDYKQVGSVEIPVTSAQLKNEVYNDNELPMYTQTADAIGTYNYNPEHGRWDVADSTGAAHQIKESNETAPTCDSVGYTTYTCSCGYQFTADYTPPHSNTDCEHKADALFDIYGTSVQAGDSLNMFFYVDAALLSGTDYKAVIQRGQPNGTVKTETIPFADWSDYTSNGKALKRFVYSGIAAKEMSEQVFVTICEEDGTILSNTYSDSIETYALDLLAATNDANLRTALVDMLNYGAACQTHFGYNTAHLANAQLTEAQKAFASSTPTCNAVTSGPDGYKDYFAEHSVSVENRLVYTFIFKDIDSSVAPVVTYTDHYGKENTLNTLSFQPDGEYYLVDVPGLAIADGCPDAENEITISCTVTTSAGTQITVNGSIEAYAKGAMNAYPNDPVFSMLMRFASSAYKYFHNLPVSQ